MNVPHASTIAWIVNRPSMRNLLAEAPQKSTTRLRPRILFVSPRQGWPATSGAKLREYHFLRAIGRHSDLTYVFYREPGLDLPSHEDLPFCRHIVPVPRPRCYSAGRIVRGLIGRWPLPVLNYTSRNLTSTLRDLLDSGRFDAVHFDGIHLAAYGPIAREYVPASRMSFDWHNIESEGMRRYATVTKSLMKALYARMTARRLESVERELIRSGYRNVVCSDRERSALASDRLAVVKNDTDTSFFSGLPKAKPRRILFVGLMSYHANIDAAIWFAREVWPKLRGELPGYTFTIAGADPAPAVRALAAEPGVEVTGTVADLRPYYSEAVAAVIPLRVGAGTRLKILEAMAAGTPVVSSRLGAEGLGLAEGREILIAEGPDEWVQALLSLRDNELHDRLVRAARIVATKRYDWCSIEDSLWSAYQRWMEESPLI